LIVFLFCVDSFFFCWRVLGGGLGLCSRTVLQVFASGFATEFCKIFAKSFAFACCCAGVGVSNGCLGFSALPVAWFTVSVSVSAAVVSAAFPAASAFVSAAAVLSEREGRMAVEGGGFRAGVRAFPERFRVRGAARAQRGGELNG